MKIIEGNKITNEQFLLIEEALRDVKCYDPIDLTEIEPANKEERRKWLKELGFSFPVSVFTYRLGNYLGNFNNVWKIPKDSKDRTLGKECKIINDIRDDLNVYGTRGMQKEFIQKYNRFASTAVLGNMYQFLTNLEYAPENHKEGQIDLRLCKYLLENEDTELIYDLRKNNGRVCDKEFEPFCLN